MTYKELCKKYGVEEDSLNTRFDGRIEWVCEHGVGHTIWWPGYPEDKKWSIHGCDGCCKELFDKNDEY
jgi:hypothetical protein